MKHTKLFLSLILILLVLLSLAVPTVAYTGDSSTVYIMFVGDRQVGTVRFAARALSIYDKVEDKLREEHKDEIYIDSDVYFKGTRTGLGGITDAKELAKSIEDAIDVKIKAHAIVVDGTKVCYVSSLQEAEKVMDEIKSPYVEAIEEKEDSQLEEVSIKEDLSFKEELVSENIIISSNEALELILQENQDIEEYEVKEGDTIWSIAEANDVDVADIELANPDIEDDLIRPGDIIKISQQQSLLTVVTKENTKYSKEIPFETQVEEDNSLEKGKTKVVQEGEKGEKEVQALVTKENGQEISRDIIEEKVIKEPVKRIELKGTKVARSSTSNSKSKSSSSAPAPTDRGSRKGSDVANYAMKFVGYPYARNGKGPSGFDCSGFTSYVYRQFGVNITHSSVGQRSVGKSVSKSNLQPGDIVCFTGSGGASGHVGIYIGGNQFVHASTYKTGVKVSSLNDGRYPQRYVTARRIFN